MSDTRISSRRDGHWLIFEHSDYYERQVIMGCHCGFAADMDSDCGWGDSVVDHIYDAGRVAALPPRSPFSSCCVNVGKAECRCDRPTPSLTLSPEDFDRLEAELAEPPQVIAELRFAAERRRLELP